jgi:hypothetical protein
MDVCDVSGMIEHPCARQAECSLCRDVPCVTIVVAVRMPDRQTVEVVDVPDEDYQVGMRVLAEQRVKYETDDQVAVFALTGPSSEAIREAYAEARAPAA